MHILKLPNYVSKDSAYNPEGKMSSLMKTYSLFTDTLHVQKSGGKAEVHLLTYCTDFINESSIVFHSSNVYLFGFFTKQGWKSLFVIYSFCIVNLQLVQV